MLTAMTSQDADRLEAVLEELGVARQRIDRISLQRDLDHVLRQYYGRQLADLNISAVLADILGIVRRYHLQLPTNMALLVKTIVMEEGLGVQLDPNFNLATVLAPYARRLLVREYSPLV
jgi:ubiquinone biosynthesis protein